MGSKRPRRWYEKWNFRLAILAVLTTAILGGVEIAVSLRSSNLSQSEGENSDGAPVSTPDVPVSSSPVQRGGPSLTVLTDYEPSPQDWLIPLDQDELRSASIAPSGPGPDGKSYTADDITCEHPTRFDWVRSLGGIPAGEVKIPISVTVNLDSVVLLRHIRVDIVERQEFVEGTAVALCRGAGPVNVWKAHIDLDAPGLPVNFEEPSIPSNDDITFPQFEVRAGRTEQFLVQASTAESYVRFALEMEFLVNGEIVTEKIFDNGVPFEVTACTGPAISADDLRSFGERVPSIGGPCSHLAN